MQLVRQCAGKEQGGGWSTEHHDPMRNVELVETSQRDSKLKLLSKYVHFH